MAIRDDFYRCETDVKLHGKVALVTGATSGTGLEVAKNLARRGAKVIITGRDRKRMEDAEKTIRESSGNENILAKQLDFERPHKDLPRCKFSGTQDRGGGVLAMAIRDDFYRCETDVKLQGKVALVTGATSGTGLEVAKNLARRGAKVIITGRDRKRLEDAEKTIRESSGNQNILAKQLDFERLSSVRNFVSETMTTEPKLDILINNVGAIGLSDTLTQDNLHLMMQVNYFGTFLLTYLLFPLLKASAPSRIVNVSSLALILGHIDLDHMNDIGKYSNFGFYSNAKLAEVLFTVEMNKRIRGSGVNVYSIDPGLGKSKFFRNLHNEALKDILNKGLEIFGLPLHRVATLPVFLAIDPSVDNDSGKHFRYCEMYYSSWFADDEELTRDLWEESKRLVNITGSEDWENNI